MPNKESDEFYHYKQVFIAAKRHEKNNSSSNKQITNTTSHGQQKQVSSLPVIYILDGYPRTIMQAVKLHHDIGEVRAAVHLLCTPAVLHERNEAQHLLLAQANRIVASK